MKTIFFRKRVTSLVLMFVLGAGCLETISPMLSSAATHTYEEDTILTSNDYEEAKKAKDQWSGFKSSSGDLFPAVAPDDSNNMVLRYNQCMTGLGIAILGNEYRDTIVTDGICVQKNTCYEVDFDYYTTGTVGEHGALEIGLAVGGTDLGDVDQVDFYNRVSLYQPVLSFPKNTALTSGWYHQKAYLTVDEKNDLSKGANLLLYAKGGGINEEGAHVCFDNIRVTALAGVEVQYQIGEEKETVYYADGIIKPYKKLNTNGQEALWYLDSSYTKLFSIDEYQRSKVYQTIALYGKWPGDLSDKDILLTENDYSGAMTQWISEAGESSNVWPGLFVGSSGDTIPVNDPNDSSNQVMMYSHFWYGKGALFLGSNYKMRASKEVKKDTIKVKAGLTYEVEFDFYAQGEVNHEKGLNVYLAVGDNPGNDISESYTINTSYQKLITKYNVGHQFDMTNWQRNQKARITVPVDADLSNGSYLMLMTEYGDPAADLYFDNVKVRILTSADVIYQYKDEEGTLHQSKEHFEDGYASDKEIRNSDGERIYWYDENGKRILFEDGYYDVGTQYKTITLYGYWVVTGDTNNDGIVSAEDFETLVGYLVGKTDIHDLKAADLNYDGFVDVRDIVRYKKEYGHLGRSVVYVSATGSDSLGTGSENSPIQTFQKALEFVPDNGTIHILGKCEVNTEWTKHDKTVIVTGDTLDFSVLSEVKIRDNVTFTSIHLEFPDGGSVYACGNQVSIGDVRNSSEDIQVTGTTTIYGGDYKTEVEQTKLTLLSGNYSTIYGGGYEGIVNGDTYLYIAGNVNNFPSSGYSKDNGYKIYGGAKSGQVKGNTYVYVGGNVNANLNAESHDELMCLYGGSYGSLPVQSTTVEIGGNAKFNYVYGGGFGGTSGVIRQSVVNVRDRAKIMSVYGGGAGAPSCQGSTYVYMTGGEVEQIFGACRGKSMTGNTVVKVVGGTVKRRIFGGCYNDWSWSWKSSYYVTGNTTVILGENATLITGTYDDYGISASSRIGSNNAAEVAAIQFVNEAAKKKFESKIGIQYSTFIGPTYAKADSDGVYEILE